MSEQFRHVAFFVRTPDPLPRYDRVGCMSDNELRHSRALYEGMITMTDTWLGYLFATLKTLDLWDNSAILLWIRLH